MFKISSLKYIAECNNNKLFSNFDCRSCKCLQNIVDKRYKSDAQKSTQITPYHKKNKLLKTCLTVRFVSLTSCLRYPDKKSTSFSFSEVIPKIRETINALRSAKPEPKGSPKKKSWTQLIVDELKHYWNGFKLLYMNMKISKQLIQRTTKGEHLTRREHRLLTRTYGDLLRMIPFSVFIVVPFSEFVLPFYLTYLPSWLPSTFEKQSQRDENLKRSLQVKLKMAKILQDTLLQMSAESKGRHSQTAKEFVDWFRRVRSTGEQVSTEDIVKYAKLFKDEITLDTLSRGQLVALCKVVEVQSLGTNSILRFLLRMKLRELAADDKMIYDEGIEKLNLRELQNACKTRGMRAFDIPEEQMRAQLGQWLDLSLNHKVPPSLLLLSRALMLPDNLPTTDKLKATINMLPSSIEHPTKCDIGETEGKICNKSRLEALKQELRLCNEERDELKEESKRKKRKVRDASDDDEETVSSADLKVLETAIDSIMCTKCQNALTLEKRNIKDLKQGMATYQKCVEELKQIDSDVTKPNIKLSTAAKRLHDKMEKMMERIDHTVAQLDKKTQKTEETVHKAELLEAIKKSIDVPNKEDVIKQIENMLNKINTDDKGTIKVEYVLELIKFLAHENVHLTSKHIDDVIEVRRKEGKVKGGKK